MLAVDEASTQLLATPHPTALIRKKQLGSTEMGQFGGWQKASHFIVV